MNLEESMLSAGASPASPTVLPGSASAMPTNETCGESSRESFAQLDPDGSWLKIPPGYSRAMADDTLVEFSGTWPVSGMMQNGKCYQLAPLEHHTHGRECSLLPTPQASDEKGSCQKLSWKRHTTYHLKHWVHGTALAIHSRTLRSSWVHPDLACYLMGFPQHWLSDRRYDSSETP